MTPRDQDSGWSWWERLLLWGPVPVGVALLIWGDTVDRVFGAGIVGVPMAALGWAAWKVLRERRAKQRDSGHAPPDGW